MKFGDVVKFREPANAGEANETFVVRELRGDRVLVAGLETGFSIVPTFVYRVEDLEVIARTDGLLANR